MVSVDGVTKSFGAKAALRNISFSVPAGQISGLLGPNGAGKTTLFRLLMGILKATGGTLQIDGLDTFESRIKVKRLIGFQPDEPVFVRPRDPGTERRDAQAGRARRHATASVYLYPAEAWKVALVGTGWLVFARSMAEKTVTLVTVTSESGDAEPIPRSRRWAASLGMLTFAIGVFTQQWSLAVVGVVYSHLTAAAMWENFRARLPFLYDPCSERLPPRS